MKSKNPIIYGPASFLSSLDFKYEVTSGMLAYHASMAATAKKVKRIVTSDKCKTAAVTGELAATAIQHPTCRREPVIISIYVQG